MFNVVEQTLCSIFCPLHWRSQEWCWQWLAPELSTCEKFSLRSSDKFLEKSFHFSLRTCSPTGVGEQQIFSLTQLKWIFSSSNLWLTSSPSKALMYKCCPLPTPQYWGGKKMLLWSKSIEFNFTPRAKKRKHMQPCSSIMITGTKMPLRS